MNNLILHGFYKLSMLAVILFACSSVSNIDKIWCQLLEAKWVSSKLFEASDYRDYIIFESKTEFLFFDAASSIFYKGTYEIQNDTLNLAFVEDELNDLKLLRLVFKVDHLQFYESEFLNGKKYQTSNSSLKYKREPLLNLVQACRD